MRSINLDRSRDRFCSRLQAADRGTPFQETLKAIDEMHKQGKFKTFAISNFTSAEVSPPRSSAFRGR
jgi:aryl-alcohol dehydrogenase-like predicted oxidoreductase